MLLNAFLWPGDRFCEMVGSSVEGDAGLLRGFVNSIAWGLVAVLVIIMVL